jgi:riboflavin kinase / FMN adenylyltransferase
VRQRLEYGLGSLEASTFGILESVSEKESAESRRMKLLHGFEDQSACRSCFLSIGNFDGVHRGHQAMISVLVSHARRSGAPAVVFTFDPHPITLLRPGQAPPNLSTLEDKAELLARSGVDCLIVYRTDRELLNLSPEEFFDRIIRGELAARGLVEGPNFFFGRDRAGDIHTLRTLCDVHGLGLEIVSPVKIGERMVSSSVVRSLIGAGEIAEAVELLGHPYRIRGTVVSGASRGRVLDYPTANLDDIPTLLPPDGVYAGIARWEGIGYPAAVHLGSNPTFNDSRRKFEAHLCGFDGNLYGNELVIDLLSRVRGTRTFAGSGALKAQVERDIEQVKRVAEEVLSREST